MMMPYDCLEFPLESASGRKQTLSDAHTLLSLRTVQDTLWKSRNLSCWALPDINGGFADKRLMD